MGRIDLVETIERITFPDEVWEWLDLLGEFIRITQEEAMRHDISGEFKADTQYKLILVRVINRDIKSLMAIYILLRCEIINQAAAHVRLFCESLITLKYISLHKEARSELFNNYADIEAYEILLAMLEWEKQYANPLIVSRCDELLQEKRASYDKLKPIYSSQRKGRKRSFKNWCDKRIDEQATDCGHNMLRLYKIVYKQMSSYIHGSAWSLRRQISYSAMYYKPEIVHVDIATIVKTTLGVWVEWAKFIDEQLQWNLMAHAHEFIQQVNELDEKHFLKKNNEG